MRGLDSHRMVTRCKGRPALEQALHRLHRRVYRLATCRTISARDYRWCLEVASAIQVLLQPSENAEASNAG